MAPDRQASGDSSSTLASNGARHGEKKRPSDSDIPQQEHHEQRDENLALQEKLEGPKKTESGKRILTEDDCYDELGFKFPSWKKWMILTNIFLVQMSMNFNSSVITGAIKGITEKYGVTEQYARIAQMIMLVFYAFGCELWAPWSEEFGRWPVLQLSLFLCNIFQLPCALAPNLGSIFVGRALIGLSSAGGSVTLGMVADMWEADDQQYAVAYVVLSSVGGSTIGAVFSGLIQEQLGMDWIFWMQMAVGAITQLCHFFMVPETRATIMMDRIAKRRRTAALEGKGNPEDKNLYGPNEVKQPRINMKEFGEIWARPFIMFVREPIVLCLSLLSGFSDALIFTFFEGWQPVYDQYGFSATSLGWAFWAVEIGYLVAYLSFFPFIMRDRAIRKRDPDALQPERRLLWLLFMAPLEPLGLFAFAWTSTGPPIPWVVPTVFGGVIGAANYAIYHATIDYMIASYGPYSASATGGNGFARDFLAGIAALYASPLYHNLRPRPLPYASTILACLAVLVTLPIYVFYWKGPAIRERSKFAQTLAADRKAHDGRRASQVDPSVAGV
ncbi:major facilitator superfamily transporter [Xylariomycetidae sp. FL0641]|nr:major facilitator superfamily transporter [Xylariomycetidae sp. FL0641]